MSPMTADMGSRRTVRVVAAGNSLARALAEHRGPEDGWRFGRLAAPAADALVILDMEDEGERRRAAEALRAEGFAGPLLILGDASPGDDLDDESVGRPVRLGVLLARIDAHAADPETRGAHRLGPYEFDPVERELRGNVGTEAIRLTELECKLLACLVQGNGAVIGRDELLARVWGYSPGVATHTVETHIWRLRQKIETADPATRLLITEPGGYRLTVADDGEGD
jgi:DNA-binding winged helix-turn-helix (wHTH) protein